MATKAIKGHALVKEPKQNNHLGWQCECGALYGAATGEGRISRDKARERHRIHLSDLASQLATGSSGSEVGGDKSGEGGAC